MQQEINYPFLTTNRLLILLVIVGAALRLYDLQHIPYTYDELSSMHRTGYASFSELVEKGIRIDAHPAFIQTYWHYWTQWFGYDAWIVKLPFILMGIGGIPLLFGIGKLWYNETVGLIAAAFFATAQFAIHYAQIARPYGSGVFFALFMVYFWSKLVLTPEKNFWRNTIFFVLGASLCSYNHHFSLFFAGIVGVSGIFFLPKKYWLRYALSGLLIFLLYIPHLSIFFYQLNVGGIEAWLGKPTSEFLPKFIQYTFNYSYLSMGIALALILFGLFKFKTGNFKLARFMLFCAFYFIQFLTGYYYSIHVNSVLQFSVLIFSFPFFYFILFGHIPALKPIQNGIVVGSILLITIFSLVIERQNYTVTYSRSLEHMMTDMDHKAKHKHMGFILDFEGISVDYFKKKNKITTKFGSLKAAVTQKQFQAYVQGVTDNYFLLGTISNSNANHIPIVLEEFPYIVWQKNYVNHTAYLFSKTGTSEQKRKCIVHQSFDLVAKEKYNWLNVLDSHKQDALQAESTNLCYKIAAGEEWGSSLNIPVEKYIVTGYEFIDVSVKIYSKSDSSTAMLTASLMLGDSSTFWGASEFNQFPSKVEGPFFTKTLHYSLKLSDVVKSKKNLALQIGLWNRDKREIYIDNFDVHLREGNPILYGFYNPIPFGTKL